MAWNIDNAWPELAKLVLRRRIKEIQRRAEIAEHRSVDKTAKARKIDQLRRQIAKLELEQEEEEMSIMQTVPNVDETFSELCSDILAIVREESYGDELVRDCSFGCEPSRRWPYRRFRMRVIGRLARSGYTLRRFMAELTRRTSDRWVHFGPFGPLEQFVECLDNLDLT